MQTSELECDQTAPQESVITVINVASRNNGNTVSNGADSDYGSLPNVWRQIQETTNCRNRPSSFTCQVGYQRPIAIGLALYRPGGSKPRPGVILHTFAGHSGETGMLKFRIRNVNGQVGYERPGWLEPTTGSEPTMGRDRSRHNRQGRAVSRDGPSAGSYASFPSPTSWLPMSQG
jgi:hypothetical protein